MHTHDNITSTIHKTYAKGKREVTQNQHVERNQRMNLSAQDFGGEDATEGCCSSNFLCDSFSASRNNTKVSMDQPIHFRIMEKEFQDSITARERERATNEIIGLDVKGMDETEDFISRHLELLEVKLTKISGSIRSAYDLALKMNSNFVNNKRFRIMFLRADEFDARKAATRMMLHFKYKLDLFGKKMLVKEITFDDLSPTDQACLYTGSFQFLSEFQDKWGRNILFQFGELEQVVSWKHSTRAQWYLFMVEIQKEWTQKLGAVVVNVGSSPPENFTNFLRRVPILSQALPFRFTAIHRCCINQTMTTSTTLIRVVSSKIRSRVRFHLEESVTSCLYKLFLYGIDPARLPLDDDGKPQIETFLALLEKQKLRERQQQQKQEQAQEQTPYNHMTKEVYEQEKEKEEQRKRGPTSAVLESSHIDTECKEACSAATTSAAVSTKHVLVVPTNHDVMLGSGIKNSYYQGNAILDKMVEMDVISYKKAPSQFDKSCIVLMTIKRMESIGGRFLKCCDDDNISRSGNKNRNYEEEKEWILATDQEVRDTVSTRFRYKARKIKSLK